MKWVSAKTPPHDNRVVLITYRHRTTRELMVGNAIYDCGHWLYVTGEVLGYDDLLKAIAQGTYQKTHSYEEWFARYGKNYL